MIDMDGWLEAVRRIALEVVGGRQGKGTLVATSYNPQNHTVKGIIVPHGIESGDVPIAATHVGNGFGILVGPTIGDATKLNGDQFDIDFEFGDPNSMIAKHRQFSKVDNPPVVQSGEILLQHQSGSSVKFAADKTLTLTGSAGSTTVHGSDGSITHTDSSGGVIFQKGGQVFLGSKTAANAVQTTAGASTKVFSE